MATTFPDELVSPDNGTNYDIPAATAAMQDSVQDALNRIREGISYQTGTDAERLALSGTQLYEGLTFWATDTRIEWVYTASAWKPVGGNTTLAVLRRTGTALSSATGSYSRISTTAGWSATGGELRSATFTNNELVVQTPGWYQVFWTLWSTGSNGGIAGISVNAASGATTIGAEALHALSHVSFNVSALGSASAMVKLAAGDRLSLWGYGAGGPLTIRSGPEPTHWGARWVSA